VHNDKWLLHPYRYYPDRPLPPWPKRPTMESVPADTPHCPPDVEEIAEAYCMETLDRPASLAFENHYLACPRCASIVASADEYIRSRGRRSSSCDRRERRARTKSPTHRLMKAANRAALGRTG